MNKIRLPLLYNFFYKYIFIVQTGSANQTASLQRLTHLIQLNQASRIASTQLGFAQPDSSHTIQVELRKKINDPYAQ
jgi:hypothetical protein